MSEANNYNNQETQSTEFIDRIGDSNTNTITTPEILTKNSNSQDNDGQNIIEDFSQSNKDSRNTSDKKVSDNSSLEPQKIFRSQSDDSPKQNDSNQLSEIKNYDQSENDEEYSVQQQKEMYQDINLNQNDVDDRQSQQEYQNIYSQIQEKQHLNDSQTNEDNNMNQEDIQDNQQVQQEYSSKQQEGYHNQDNNQVSEQIKDEGNQTYEQNKENEIKQMNDSEENRDEEEQKFNNQNKKEIEKQQFQPEQQKYNEKQNNSDKIQNQNNIDQIEQKNNNSIQYENNNNEINQLENQTNNTNSQNRETQDNNIDKQNNKVQQNEEYIGDGQYNAQRQYEYMIEMQKRQSEFQRQMEELNQKYKINFRKIIDVRQESLEGNYMAGLLAIKMKYKDIDTKDQYGMSILHNAVLGNEKELVIFLLNNGADVNSQDICQRTALMMAAHGGASQKQEDTNNQTNKKNFDEDSEELRKQLKLHSFNKIFKILIDKGACFATKDAYQFSALLYSVQNQNLLILFYLIYLGSNLRDSDSNGSSVVHWNAYKGNQFLMEVFNTLNLDMFTADNQGYTPLSRSILGISYNTVEYLAGLLPPEQVPEPDLKEDDGNYKIPSISLRHILKEAKYGHLKLSNKILKWWSDLCVQYIQLGFHPATFIFFIVSVILFYSSFTSIYNQRNYSGNHQNESWLSSMSFMINIIFFISTFVYMSFSIRIANTMVGYKNRNQGIYILDNDAINRTEQMKIEDERNIPPYMKSIVSDKVQFERILQRMNFKHLDRLLDDAPQYISTQNQQEDLNRTVVTDNGDDESRIGLTSNQQSSHKQLTFIHQIAILFENNYFTSLGNIDFKRLCGTCLKYKPEKTQHCYICKTCVPYYQFHSVLFNMCISAENHLLYLLHLFSLWFSLLTYLMIQQISFSQYLESWQIFKYAEIPYHMSYKIGIFHSLVYLIVFFSFIYISIYSAIEILGIFEDKTRDEILNPFDYSYNYEVISDKNRNLVKVSKVRTTGLTEYLKSTLTIVYYRTLLYLKHKK